MNSVISIESFSLSLAGGIGTLQVFHLFFSGRKNSFANRVLALFLVSILYINLLNWLWITGLLYQVPHLFRTGRPLSYFFAPLIFIYLRASLYKENNFRQYDWVFFLPTVLVYFEFLPFYLSPILYKLQSIATAINIGVDVQEGILIGKFHGLLFIFFDLLIGFMIFRMIKKFLKKKKENTIEDRTIIKWITQLIIVSILVLVAFLLFWLIKIDQKTILYFYFLQNASIIYFVSAYLLIKPAILDGTYPVDKLENRTPKRVDIIPSNKFEEYEVIMNKLIREDRIFLKQRLTLKQLSEISGISIHHLSAFVNKKYSMSFSDFINKLRIEYVIQRLNSGEWRKFNLEGMAQEAGFASRTAFFSAFKKNTGISPSDFLKKQNVASISN